MQMLLNWVQPQVQYSTSCWPDLNHYAVCNLAGWTWRADVDPDWPTVQMKSTIQCVTFWSFFFLVQGSYDINLDWARKKIFLYSSCTDEKNPLTFWHPLSSNIFCSLKNDDMLLAKNKKAERAWEKKAGISDKLIGCRFFFFWLTFSCFCCQWASQRRFNTSSEEREKTKDQHPSLSRTTPNLNHQTVMVVHESCSIRCGRSINSNMQTIRFPHRGSSDSDMLHAHHVKKMFLQTEMEGKFPKVPPCSLHPLLPLSSVMFPLALQVFTAMQHFHYVCLLNLWTACVHVSVFL